MAAADGDAGTIGISNHAAHDVDRHFPEVSPQDNTNTCI
jgi:hypothetical protein